MLLEVSLYWLVWGSLNSFGTIEFISTIVLPALESGPSDSFFLSASMVYARYLLILSKPDMFWGTFELILLASVEFGSDPVAKKLPLLLSAD